MYIRTPNKKKTTKQIKSLLLFSFQNQIFAWIDKFGFTLSSVACLSTKTDNIKLGVFANAYGINTVSARITLRDTVLGHHRYTYTLYTRSFHLLFDVRCSLSVCQYGLWSTVYTITMKSKHHLNAHRCKANSIAVCRTDNIAWNQIELTPRRNNNNKV